LWRGLKPSLVLTVNPAITYGMFERLKTVLLSEGEAVGPGKAFVLGAASKTLATVVTYPYIMAKTRLQAKYEEVEGQEVGGEGKGKGKEGEKVKRKERYDGAVDCLRQVRREQGLVGWYQVNTADQGLGWHMNWPDQRHLCSPTRRGCKPRSLRLSFRRRSYSGSKISSRSVSPRPIRTGALVSNR